MMSATELGPAWAWTAAPSRARPLHYSGGCCLQHSWLRQMAECKHTAVFLQFLVAAQSAQPAGNMLLSRVSSFCACSSGLYKTC